MSCSGCGKNTSSNSYGTGRATTKGHAIAPSHMHTANKFFNFGPYGNKVAKTIVGRVTNPRSNKKR